MASADSADHEGNRVARNDTLMLNQERLVLKYKGKKIFTRN